MLLGVFYQHFELVLLIIESDKKKKTHVCLLRISCNLLLLYKMYCHVTDNLICLHDTW